MRYMCNIWLEGQGDVVVPRMHGMDNCWCLMIRKHSKQPSTSPDSPVSKWCRQKLSSSRSLQYFIPSVTGSCTVVPVWSSDMMGIGVRWWADASPPSPLGTLCSPYQHQKPTSLYMGDRGGVLATTYLWHYYTAKSCSSLQVLIFSYR